MAAKAVVCCVHMLSLAQQAMMLHALFCRTAVLHTQSNVALPAVHHSRSHCTGCSGLHQPAMLSSASATHVSHRRFILCGYSDEASPGITMHHMQAQPPPAFKASIQALLPPALETAKSCTPHQNSQGDTDFSTT